MRERIRLGQVDQGILEEGNNLEKEKKEAQKQKNNGQRKTMRKFIY